MAYYVAFSANTGSGAPIGEPAVYLRNFSADAGSNTPIAVPSEYLNTGINLWCQAVCFTSTADMVAIATQYGVKLWRLVNNTFVATQAEIAGTNVRAATFDPTNSVLGVIYSDGTYLRPRMYPVTPTGFGSLIADPSSPFGSYSAQQVVFSPKGDVVIIRNYLTNVFNVYRWTSTGFGEALPAPTGLANGAYNGVAISPDGTLACIVGDDPPYIHLYDFSAGGFGAKKANPTTPMTVGGTTPVFSGDSKAVITNTYDGVTGVAAYAVSSAGFGAKFTSPSISDSIGAIGLSPFGDKIFAPVDDGSSATVHIIGWSASGFGAQTTISLAAANAWGAFASNARFWDKFVMSYEQ